MRFDARCPFGRACRGNEPIPRSTQKQKNRHGRGAPVWPSWIVGRLGEWTGYCKKPGQKVMHIDLTSSISQKKAASSRRGTKPCESRTVTIPGYEVGAAIHQSRLRSIYRAKRLADDLPVVIKTLNAEYPSKQDVAGLRREFHIIQQLH